jgi:hypothetical protein
MIAPPDRESCPAMRALPDRKQRFDQTTLTSLPPVIRALPIELWLTRLSVSGRKNDGVSEDGRRKIGSALRSNAFQSPVRGG